MYRIFKSLSKPIKYGAKYSKGLGTGLASVTHKALSDNASFITQLSGMLLLPVIYLIIEPMVKKLPLSFQKKLPFIFYAGITAGSCLGATLSTTVLKSAPSSAVTLLAIIITVATASGLGALSELFFPQDKSSVADQNDEKANIRLRHRFWLGLELGALMGSSLGAMGVLIHPTVGMVASAVGGFIGTLAGAGIAIFGPDLLDKFKTADAVPSSKAGVPYSHITKSVRIGGLLGTCLGVVMGTLVFPGLGSVLGGVLFGGVFGAAAGGTSWVVTHSTVATRFKDDLLGRLFANKLALSKLSLHMKVGASGASLIGALIGTFVLPGLGTAAGASLGTLIGLMLGAVPPLLQMTRSNNTDHPNTIDQKSLKETATDSTVMLYKKAKLGFSLGSTAGAIIGGLIGSFIPVVGTILGGVFGSFMGGAMGVWNANLVARSNEKNLAVPPPKVSTSEPMQPTYSSVSNDLNSAAVAVETLPAPPIPAPPVEVKTPEVSAPIAQKEAILLQKHMFNARPRRTACRDFSESRVRTMRAN